MREPYRIECIYPNDDGSWSRTKDMFEVDENADFAPGATIWIRVPLDITRGAKKALRRLVDAPQGSPRGTRLSDFLRLAEAMVFVEEINEAKTSETGRG